MRHQFLVSLGALAAVIAVVSLASVPAAGQAPAAAAKTTKTWTPPRTPWGDPDLQGIYTNKDFFQVPFERPRQFGERQLMTDEEFAKRVADAKKTLLDEPEERGNSEGELLRAPLFWHERGNPTRRTSLVVDPPDGRIPPFTPEAQKRAKEESSQPALREFGADGRGANTWLDRSVHERCITKGTPGSQMPSQYNSEYQILQIPGYVVIRTEMDHETRTIPLDGRPHLGPALRQWMGDPRGHWEGTTLVVETTNFTDKLLFRGAAENLRVVERFTRLDPDTVNWEVTLEDPTTWTRPWTFAVPMTSKAEQIQGGLQATSEIWVLPYECHEGNYGLLNILRTARGVERNEEAAKRK